MALFRHLTGSGVPLGVLLIRKNLITQRDMDTALNYQKEHPEKRMSEIFHILNLCSDEELLKVLAERLGVKYYFLPKNIYEMFDGSKFIPIDVMREYKVVPFGFTDLNTKDTLMVCFSNPEDQNVRKKIERILKSKGLKMEVFITFASYIDAMFEEMDKQTGKSTR